MLTQREIIGFAPVRLLLMAPVGMAAEGPSGRSGAQKQRPRPGTLG